MGTILFIISFRLLELLSFGSGFAYYYISMGDKIKAKKETVRDKIDFLLLARTRHADGSY